MIDLVVLQQPLVVSVHHVSVGHHHVPQCLDPLIHLLVQLPAQFIHLGSKQRQFFGNGVVHFLVRTTFVLVFQETNKIDFLDPTGALARRDNLGSWTLLILALRDQEVTRGS